MRWKADTSSAEGRSHERRRYVHSDQRSDRFRAGHCQVSGRNHKGQRRLAKTEKIIMGNHQNFFDRLLQVERGSVCLRWRLSGSSLCTDPPPLRKNAKSCQCDDFQIACYVLTTGPKTNQNTLFAWCSGLRVTANQIIFHTLREKSRGLHTRLTTVNHRRPFS